MVRLGYQGRVATMLAATAISQSADDPPSGLVLGEIPGTPGWFAVILKGFMIDGARTGKFVVHPDREGACS